MAVDTSNKLNLFETTEAEYHNTATILDSAATHHFTPISTLNMSQSHKIHMGPTVRVATGQTTIPKYAALLPLHPSLSKEAQHTYVLDNLPAGTLISLGQLCDDDCIALFTKYNVKIIKNNQIIIVEGKRNDQRTGLWQLDKKPVTQVVSSPKHQIQDLG